MRFAPMSSPAAILAVALFASGLGAAETLSAATGSLFSPTAVKSLGALTVPAGGTITFHTGSATSAPVLGGALSGSGAIGVSAGGKVQVALFAFDSINLAAGATVEVTGDRGLVLLSKSGITIDTVIALNGGNGYVQASPQLIGAGAPGAEGGEYGKTLNSAPPPADAGDGGPPMKDSGRPGRGFGAGYNQRVKGVAPGGGGAYGGAGGDSSEGSEGGGSRVPRPMKGGTVYGDPALAELFGGSGGAGASNDRGGANGGGGGGGGAIALIALGDITIGPKGAILAVGGRGSRHEGGGGGGSGGGILLAAPSVKLAPGSCLAANGGEGASGGSRVAAGIVGGRGRRHSGSGGGGGGGRIAIYSKDDLGAAGENRVEPLAPAGCNIDGGNGGYLAQDGQTGTFYDGAWPGLK